MGCCHSKPVRGSHPTHHHQIPLAPDANGAASASFSSSPSEVKFQGGTTVDGKLRDGPVGENNNIADSMVTPPALGVDAVDGIKRELTTIGIQTDTWYPQDSSAKMPLLNGSAVVAGMGLENLGFQDSSPSLAQDSRCESPSPPITAGLDESQRTLVENTWKTLEKNPDLHGSIMFAKLATDYPDIGKLFPFGGKGLTYDQLLADSDVRTHGRRVIETIGSVIEDLDDMELVIQILKDLGERHNAYNAKKTHIKAVGGALLFTIEQALGAGYTPDVKAAWTAVFNIISDTMSKTLSGGPLTTREKDLVRKTWGVLSLDTEQHGAAMFAKLLSSHVDIARLFPFGKNLSYNQLRLDPTLRAHGKRVMETIGQAVASLDDLDILVPVLRDLARRHVGYNVNRKQFEPVGEALIHAIREGLGRSFSEEVEKAWLVVFNLIVSTMSDMLPEESKEVLSATQRRLLQDTWKKLSRDPERHGAAMFAKLTISHPDIGKIFPFGGKGLTYDQLLRNRDVKAHGKRVFETVGQAVNGLDDLDLLIPTLKDLAKRHAEYNVQKRYFVPTGEAFLHAIRLGLGPSAFTPDVKDSWHALYKIVTDVMADELSDGPITATQKSLVQTSWKTIKKDTERHGAVMFAKLVTDNPNLAKLFPFGTLNLSYEELIANKDLKAHGKRVIDTVGVAVSGLDDMELLVPILQDLAKRHAGYNVTRQHFKPVGGALMHALREGLGKSFTPELEAAWSAVYGVVADTMSPLLPAGGLTTEQKNLIKGSWRIVAPEKAKCGAVMFAKLVTEYPEVGRLFPFGRRNQSYQSLLIDDKVRAHGLRVMQTIADAIRVLDNLDKLLPILGDLGKRHTAYGVTREHFAPVGKALIETLGETLGNSFNENTKNAWLTFWQLIVDTMAEELTAPARDNGLLTKRQKEIVQRTWKMLSPDPGKHGAVMFARLVTDHPDVGRLFPFGNKGMTYHQLLWDDQVKAHGKRVMQTVGHAVDGLNDLDALIPILRDLAKRHVEYYVNKKHFEPVGEALIYAVQKGIGNAFDKETKEAWLAVFGLVVNTMSEELPDAVEEQGPLTSQQKRLVQTTWKKLATNPTKHGSVMFAKLVSDNRDIGKLFPFGGKNRSYQEFLKDPQVQAHGRRVMETVGTAVDGLDDLSLLVPILKELATRHIGYSVTKAHFEPVGAALIHAIKEGLGSSFSPDIQSAWVAVFQVIVDTMSDVLPGGCPLTSKQKEIVQRTWRVLAPNPAKHGAVMFAKLVTKHPEVGKLFPFGRENLSYAELLKNTQAQAHGKKVMETVGIAVEGLNDLDVLVPILKELGGRHNGYGVNKQLFLPVGEALLNTIKEALADDYNDDVEKAWTRVFKIVSDTMSEAMSDGPITAEHKRLVQETWAKLAGHPAKHGATMFAKLVTDYPSVSMLFPFGGKGLSYDELLVNPQVQAHGTRVMQTVGTAVDGLDDLDLLVPILQELATRHIAYGVTKDHFSPVVASLMHAIRQGLGQDCNNDVEKAWLAVLKVIVDTMSDKLDDGPLNGAKKDLVRETWSILSKNPEQHGAVMFAKLVTDNPMVGKLFSFGRKKLSYDQLLTDSEVKAHGRRVMETVGHAVSGLDDLDLLVPILQELATRHIQYGVTKKHFLPVGQALMHAIQKGLGKRFTTKVSDAWGAVFALVTDTMSKLLPDDDGPKLTKKTIRLVQESWKVLAKDHEKHGAVMFARLTTQNPIVGRLFQFGDKNLSYGQLIANPVVRSHGSRVMVTVGQAIETLNELDVLVPVLKDLGLRHTEYHVTKLHFEPVGQALIYAIKEGLGTSFTNELKEAWTSVFGLVSDTMSEVLPDGPISSDQREVLQRTWKVVGQNPEHHGTVLFAKLATDHPLVGSLFPFGGKGLKYDQLLQDADVKKHGRQFMGTIGTAISHLSNHEVLIPMLEDLGKRHGGYGVTRRHLPVAGEALIYALKEGLGDAFTDEVRQAWEALFKLVADTMSKHLPDGKRVTEMEVMTSKQRELVRSTWELISSAPDKHGTVMFAKLVSENSKVGKLFPFGKKKQTYKKLLHENEVISHGERFMNTLGLVVGGLEQLEFLVPMLHQLATRHAGYGVNKEHFQAAKSALMFALKQGLGKSIFSSEVQEAWSAVYQFIEDIMIEKL